MTALSQILAGSRLTAAALQGIAPLAALKAVDETVTNSATLQNDDALFVQLAANAGYGFVLALGATSTEPQGSGDLKVAFTVPAGATLMWYGIGLLASAAGAITQGPVITASGSARGFGVNGSTETGLLIVGSVVNGSTIGNLQLEWAMNTAVAANSTTVKAASMLMAWQVQ